MKSMCFFSQKYSNICAVIFSEPREVYPFFKRLCTEICLSIFLDLDFEISASLAEDIVQLTTTHWHGNGLLQRC